MWHPVVSQVECNDDDYGDEMYVRNESDVKVVEAVVDRVRRRRKKKSLSKVQSKVMLRQRSEPVLPTSALKWRRRRTIAASSTSSDAVCKNRGGGPQRSKQMKRTAPHAQSQSFLEYVGRRKRDMKENAKDSSNTMRKSSDDQDLVEKDKSYESDDQLVLALQGPHLRHTITPIATTLADDDFDALPSSLLRRGKSFHSVAVLYEAAFRELYTNHGDQPTPNKARTMMCFHLLDEVLARMKATSTQIEVAESLRTELFNSVFQRDVRGHVTAYFDQIRTQEQIDMHEENVKLRKQVEIQQHQLNLAREREIELQTRTTELEHCKQQLKKQRMVISQQRKRMADLQLDRIHQGTRYTSAEKRSKIAQLRWNTALRSVRRTSHSATSASPPSSSSTTMTTYISTATPQRSRPIHQRSKSQW